MNGINAFIASITPLITVLMPVLVLLVGYWINKQTKKTTNEQTTVINDHSTETTNAVRNDLAAATGTHRALDR